jgi:hypothetical protein
MLGSTLRAFRHEALFRPIRDVARTLSQDFLVDGMKGFLSRWADHVYSEGTQIADEHAAASFASAKQAEIEAFKRQAAVQRLYADVAIPS